MLPKPLLFYVALLGTGLKVTHIVLPPVGDEQPRSGLLNLNRLKLQLRASLA